jgi:hypothetical protein
MRAHLHHDYIIDLLPLFHILRFLIGAIFPFSLKSLSSMSSFDSFVLKSWGFLPWLPSSGSPPAIGALREWRGKTFSTAPISSGGTHSFSGPSVPLSNPGGVTITRLQLCSEHVTIFSLNTAVKALIAKTVSAGVSMGFAYNANSQEVVDAAHVSFLTHATGQGWDDADILNWLIGHANATSIAPGEYAVISGYVTATTATRYSGNRNEYSVDAGADLTTVPAVAAAIDVSFQVKMQAHTYTQNSSSASMTGSPIIIGLQLYAFKISTSIFSSTRHVKLGSIDPKGNINMKRFIGRHGSMFGLLVEPAEDESRDNRRATVRHAVNVEGTLDDLSAFDGRPVVVGNIIHTGAEPFIARESH